MNKTFDMDNLFGDLDEKDFGNSVAPAKVAPTFPCMSCAGTGLYRGTRVHQVESKCFACGGKGSHKKDHFEAMKDKRATKAKREATIAANREKRRDDFYAANPGVFAILKKHEGWNKFCFNVMSDITNDRFPNAKAVEIIRDIEAKSIARDAMKQVEREKAAIELDYASIHRMFDKARENGLKRMSYRAEGFVMSPAGSTSANAGAIYVKRATGGYLGKVFNGKFFPGHGVKPVDVEAMQLIAINPLEAAKAYGKLTGQCSCCGRGLTDHVSIELGIGPICAQKWGFEGSDSMPSEQAKVIRKAGRAKQNELIRSAIVEKTEEVNSPKPVAGKYADAYTADMTPAQKKALRAKIRKEARTNG